MRETDLEAFAAAHAAGATVVDVREPAEYVAGHVPGARLIPMGQLTSRMGELDRDRTVYLVCASGNRSGAMAAVLAKAGFDVVNVLGGTRGWIESGRSVHTGREA